MVIFRAVKLTSFICDYDAIFIHGQLQNILQAVNSRTPGIENADLCQSHAGLNLSQFQTDCLLRKTKVQQFYTILNY